MSDSNDFRSQIFYVVPTPAVSDTSCTCKFKVADGNRK